jgi:hypothetical protein
LDKSLFQRLREITANFRASLRGGTFLGKEFVAHVLSSVRPDPKEYVAASRICLIWVLDHLDPDRCYPAEVLENFNRVWWKISQCPWNPDQRKFWFEDFYHIVTGTDGLFRKLGCSPKTPLDPFP